MITNINRLKYPVVSPEQIRANLVGDRTDYVNGVSYGVLESQLKDLSDRLVALYIHTEKEIPGMLQGLSNIITNDKQAFYASTQYGIEWFRKLPYSDEAKKLIAQTLISLVTPYNPSYALALWDSIAKGDPSVMPDVAFKMRNDDDGYATLVEEEE